MVERQLRRRGIADERVLEAMGAVPRELFVPEPARAHAYRDGALAIGHEQTISQPWVAAAICEALELTGEEAVLEIGTGSGYSACVLSRLAGEVTTVELVGELAARARQALERVGARNVTVLAADGSGGVEGGALFDAIAVHAAAPRPPAGLLAQLAPGGVLVAPIAEGGTDMLTAFRSPRDGGPVERTRIAPCRFVPLLGSEGYPSHRLSGAQ